MGRRDGPRPRIADELRDLARALHHLEFDLEALAAVLAQELAWADLRPPTRATAALPARRRARRWN